VTPRLTNGDWLKARRTGLGRSTSTFGPFNKKSMNVHHVHPAYRHGKILLKSVAEKSVKRPRILFVLHVNGLGFWRSWRTNTGLKPGAAIRPI
jgi:hypothetical protein